MSEGFLRASAGNWDDKPARAADGGQPTDPQTNSERLSGQRARDSLDARIVAAYAAPSEATPTDAVTGVAAGRLDCRSAQVFDADPHCNLLRKLDSRGSTFDAYQQPDPAQRISPDTQARTCTFTK